MIQELSIKIFAFPIKIDVERQTHPIGWSVLLVNNVFTEIVFKTLVFNYEFNYEFLVFFILNHFSRILHIYFLMTAIVWKKIFSQLVQYCMQESLIFMLDEHIIKCLLITWLLNIIYWDYWVLLTYCALR